MLVSSSDLILVTQATDRVDRDGVTLGVLINIRTTTVDEDQRKR